MVHGQVNPEEMKIKMEQKKENLEKIKNIIMVSSGKGGVGKSSVSVNLAYSLLEKGLKVGILDIDIHGPSIARMTGIEGKPITVNENGKPTPIRADENLYVLTIASILKSNDDALIWRGPLVTGVIKQFFEDFQWPEIDVLIVDNPPGTGDSPLTLVQTVGASKITGNIIVSTPQDISLLDARKAINFSNKMNIKVLGIIENMSYLICPKCGEKIEVFPGNGTEKAAQDFNIELLAKLPLDVNFVKATDNGINYIKQYSDSPITQEFKKIAEKLIEIL